MGKGARYFMRTGSWIMLLGISLIMACAGGSAGQYAVGRTDSVNEAETHLAQGRPADALTAYEKALAEYQHKENDLGTLMCLERMGWINREIGEYDAAERLLQQAYPIGVRLNGDAAEIDADLGDVHLFRGDFDRAVAAYTKTIETLKSFEFKTTYSRPPSSHDMAMMYRKSKAIVHARDNLGMLYYFTGDPDKALYHLRAAEDLLERIKTVAGHSLYGMFFKLDAGIYEGMGYCYTMIGASSAEMDDLGTSVNYLEKGRDAFVKANKPNGLFMNEMMHLKYLAAGNPLMREAKDLISRGQYENALKTFDRALAGYTEEQNDTGRFTCLEKMGWLEREIGSYGNALEHFRTARDIGLRLNGDAAGIDASLGDVYLFSGDTQKAVTLYNKAVSELKDFEFKTRYAQPPSPEELSGMVRKAKAMIHAKDNLGILFYFEKQYDLALTHLEEAKSLIDKVWSVLDHPIYGKFFLHDTDFFEGVGFYHTVLAAVYGETGAMDKSAANFARGRQAFEKIGKAYGLMVNQALQIKVNFVHSDTPLKKEDLDRFYLFLQDTSRFGAQDVVWRMGYEIGKKLARENRPAEAVKFLKISVDAIESTRANLREDTIKKVFAASIQDVYGLLIPLLFDMSRYEEGFDYLERAKARAFLDILAGRSLKAKPAVDPSLVEAEKKSQQQIDMLLRQLKTALQKDRQSIYDRYKTAMDNRSAILESIKAQSLDYAATTSVSTMSSRQILAGLDKNTALVSYFIGDERLLIWTVYKGRVAATAVKTSKDEVAELTDEYREAVAARQDVLIDEVGQELAALLVNPVSDRLKDATTLYIVPSGPLNYLPFACLPSGDSRYLIQEKTLTVLPNASSLFYLDTEVTQNIGTLFAIGNPKRTEAGLSLEFAEREVAMISRGFTKRRILTQENAKETIVKTGDLKNTGIIHIAAHGIYDPEQPLKSSLLLAPDSANDGNLETVEIFSLSINPQLVVLSACQSGVGRVKRGDEVQSLNRAFLYAGAGGVVASLWNVSDQSTFELMVRLYDELNTRAPAEALRAAQMALMKTHPSPYHWASFYLTGGSVN